MKQFIPNQLVYWHDPDENDNYSGIYRVTSDTRIDYSEPSGLNPDEYDERLVCISDGIGSLYVHGGELDILDDNN